MVSGSSSPSARMSLVDRVQYAFNSVMSLRAEVAANEEKTAADIHDLSMEVSIMQRELKTLTKLVQEMRELTVNRKTESDHQELNVMRFIDDEAVETNADDIEDPGDEDPEVTFVGATWNSNKKRRFE